MLAAAFDPSQEEGGPAAGADVLQQMRAALECDVCHDTIKVRHGSPAPWSLCLGRYRAGLLTVPREGGSFDFSITLAATPELDASQKVIGEVLEGFETVRRIGDLPVISYAGQGNGAEQSRAKQCFYGSSDTFCSHLKPIKKVSISTSLL